MAISRCTRAGCRTLCSLDVRSIGSEILRDIRVRAPYYWSDWTDAVNYRVVPSTIFIFFANILPAIAFAQDMFDRTNGSYGITEVLMSNAMGGVVFGLFGGQPLTIVGLTGPVTILNSTIFEIVVPMDVNYFSFMAIVHIWSAGLHILIALFNGVYAMKYVTKMSCDIFGTFICIVYCIKSVQLLNRQFQGSETGAAYFSIVVALVTFIFGFTFVMLGKHSPYGTRSIRTFAKDYSLPLVVVFFTGFTYFPGRISDLTVQRLERGVAFQPAEASTRYGRNWGWFIHFWKGVSVGQAFLALPFAILLTLLFYFDHNISSIMAQGPPWVIRKPTTFHWDFMLLGITTFVAGILGIPAPNGLIPQAPLHTASLELDDHTIVEQRFSNTTQGLMTLGMMCGPLLIVLHLVPQGVLAGLFLMMGVPGLLGNELIRRASLLLVDPSKRNPNEPLYTVRTWVFIEFLILCALGVAGEVIITMTIAAIGFSGVLLGLMVVRTLLPYFYATEDLDLLDEPAASNFVMSALDPELREQKEIMNET